MIGRRLFTLIASSALIGTALGVASAQILALPTKSTPRPITTPNVPHIQLNVQTNPAMNDALLRQVSQMPGVVLRDTIISLPGTIGFWVDNAVPVTRPEFIVAGREFAHMHPDGSLHASLPVELAAHAVDKGWAVPHPWSDTRPGMAGFVMIYTPNTADELQVVIELVQASFDFVTGTTA